MLSAVGVTHVVTLLTAAKVGSANVAGLRARFAHTVVDLADDGRAPLGPAVAAVTAAVTSARSIGGAVYVHCYRGISRSAAAAVGYLMATEGCTYEAGLEAVRGGRCIADPNAGFGEQLQEGVGLVGGEGAGGGGGGQDVQKQGAGVADGADGS